MSGVDNRVVSMTFDNAQFERKIEETIRSLDKLRQSLDFSNSIKSTEQLNRAANNFSMDTISSGIEGVSKKFLALSTVAITVLSGIASKAIDVGASMVKSLSVDPLLDGFREYETQLNSVQTILANTASKGTTLDQVNDALQKLNEYSDQTIYNFGQMAKNIGTFTAAGVDLNTSVASIKGIANLAAMSGSSSEQASTAMYQLSQAIATGSVKLMDWNSVVNAGMGGEAFKSALFETGKAMHTLTDVPMKQTFKEWEDSGNSFRDSLQDGWITADVLTTTLSAFTGDLTEEMLVAKGFNQQQASAIVKQAAIAKAAATEVKTFTQLIGTVREAVGTGWADSFKLLIGNFTEAKQLWTDVNTSIGNFIKKSADARNDMLSTWRLFGGREAVIQGFKDSLSGIASVLKPIKDAFRDIFPAKTAKDLIELSWKFSEFAKNLKIGGDTADKLRNTFKGFFAVLEIGWEIIKGIAGVIGTFLGVLRNLGDGFLGTTSNIGEFLTKLNDTLVAGGGISRFFENITDNVKKLGPIIDTAKTKLAELFGGGVEVAGDGIANVSDRVKTRLENLKTVAEKVGDAFHWLGDRFQALKPILDKVWDVVSTWVDELKAKFAALMEPGDFDAALDALNTSLLGGIVILLKKFLSGGLDINLGGGITKSIVGTFDQLTGTLKAMQTEIKADALLKIAGAIAILTASLVILSLIDSAALTKALTAVSVGFGQLVTAMALLGKVVSGPKDAAKLVLLGGALILLGGALLILSFAVKNLADLNWDELAKGLVGVGALLAIISLAVIPLSRNSSGMISAGIGLIGISVGLLILSKAVKEFSEMDWGEMGKGMVGVAGGLLIIAGAMQLMPPGMALMGVGIIAVATGLIILSKAVESFGAMDWGVMGKGMLGIAGGLLIIAGTMQLMPANLPITAAGLILVSIALNIMASAVQKMGEMDFGTMAKGIGGLAAVLLILVIATNAMTGAIVGAAALLIVSAALAVLASVLKTFASLSWGDLLKGLVGIAAVLVILGVAGLLLQPVIPALLGLGAALLLLGAGFALFGIGAFLVAKAFEALAKSGEAGAKALVNILSTLIAALPVVVQALASSLIDLAMTFVKAAPVVLKGLQAVLEQLLETVVALSPKIAEAFTAMILSGLDALVKIYPKLIDAGLKLLLALLKGIRDNIGEIVIVAVEIISNFLNGLADSIHLVADAGVNLIIAFIFAISGQMNKIIDAGVNLLIQFLLGISNNISKVISTVTMVITAFITQVAAMGIQIAKAGTDALVAFLNALAMDTIRITNAITALVVTIINHVGSMAKDIAQAGTDALVDFLGGITDNMRKVTDAVGTLVTTFTTEIGNLGWKITDAGGSMIINIITGIGKKAEDVVTAGVATIKSFIQGLGKNAVDLANAAGQAIVDFLNGLTTAVNTYAPQIREAGAKLGVAIIDGMTGGLLSKAQELYDEVKGVAGKALGFAGDVLGIGSPSKEFMKLGEYMMAGMSLGIKNDTTVEDSLIDLADKAKTTFQDAMSSISSTLENIGEFNPVITPVLDISGAIKDAKTLSSFINTNPVTADLSFSQAKLISHTTDIAPSTQPTTPPPPPTEVNFEQNIYSPTALTTNDIYKNTRSQIALAKEELSIP